MDENNKKIEKAIQDIIEKYEYVVKNIYKEAQSSTSRAYGGIIRSGIGQLVENIAERIVLVVWETLNQNPRRISFDTTAVKVPIKKNYINKVKNPTIKENILKNIDKYYYSQKTDKHVLIDNKLVMAIECKAYTENAMMKRILVDFSLLKQANSDISCVLLQLESQLGGDYSDLKDITLGSPSTHTLLSNFDIDLNIITLLKGERKIERPIHLPEYYKPLTKESLYKAIEIIKGLLEKHKKESLKKGLFDSL